MPERAISLLGIATLIGIAILLSTNLRAIAAGSLSNLMSATLAGMMLNV